MEPKLMPNVSFLRFFKKLLLNFGISVTAFSFLVLSVGGMWYLKRDGSLVVVGLISFIILGAVAFLWSAVAPHIVKYERVLKKIDSGQEDAEVSEVLSSV